MNKILIGASAVVMAFAPLAASAAGLGGGFSSADPGTIGPLISGGIYGNTSNPSGNGEGVLPSLAPGPWSCDYTVNGTCYAPTNPGGSMGEFLAPTASGGVATPDFADGNDQDIDFSTH